MLSLYAVIYVSEPEGVILECAGMYQYLICICCKNGLCICYFSLQLDFKECVAIIKGEPSICVNLNSHKFYFYILLFVHLCVVLLLSLFLQSCCFCLYFIFLGFQYYLVVILWKMISPFNKPEILQIRTIKKKYP